MRTFISESCFSKAMALLPNESSFSISSHVMWGLSKEDLIDPVGWAMGSPEELKKFSANIKGSNPGIMLGPSALGVDLLLWAFGNGHIHTEEFLNPAVTFDSQIDMEITEEFMALASTLSQTE